MCCELFDNAFIIRTYTREQTTFDGLTFLRGEDD